MSTEKTRENPAPPGRGSESLASGVRTSVFTHSQRALLIGGIGLIVAGLLSGEIFALFIAHVLNAELRQIWASLIELAAEGREQELAPLLDRLRDVAAARGEAMSLHSHIGSYGLLAALIGLAKYRMDRGSVDSSGDAILIILGAALQALGMYAPHMGTSIFSIADLGAVLLLCGVAWAAARMIRGPPHATTAGRPVAPIDNTLILIGSALVGIGLIFGLYVAWRHIAFEHPALIASFDQTFRALRSGDAIAAGEAFAEYKTIQTRVDITAASHSHAILFGLILIVMSFSIRAVKLSRTERAAARGLAIAGAILLPIFVYLAPRYGFTFALCADSAGALVILALLILLKGLLTRGGELPAPAPAATEAAADSSPARSLAVAALLALSLGLAASLVWSRIDAETPRLVQREEVGSLLSGVASSSERAGDAAAAHVRSNLAHSRAVNAHAHFLNLGILVLGAVLLLTRTTSIASSQRRLAILLGFGVLAYPLGLILDARGIGDAAHVVAAAGSLAVVGVLAFLWLQVWKGNRE